MHATATVVVLAWLCPGAAPVGDLVPFVLPYDDGAPGPTDLSAWSPRPADRRIRITPDGHLGVDGRRVRLLGVNCCAAAAWPDKADAPKIAARLAKFGVNAVRFHHLEAQWTRPHLLRYDRRTSRQFNPDVLDRLDYFVAQLKKHGIYLDLNLLVSRRFFAGDGLPRSIETLDWKDQHRLGFFDPTLVELQKEYARTLLGHRNPYTGATYAEDPAVALVEICNENGLVVSHFQGKLDRLPAPYASRLQQRWNAWLKRRYKTTAAVRRAWKARNQPLGRSLLQNGDFTHGTTAWRLERHQGARATATTAAGQNGQRALCVRVTRLGRASWHVQLIQAGFAVKRGAIYTLTFAARADAPCRIAAHVGQDGSPWGGLGLRMPVNLTGTWQRHTATFVATGDETNARLGFTGLGARRGTYLLADVSLRPGGSVGLASDCGVEQGTIPTVARHAATPAPAEMTADWVRFLAELETAYWQTMHRFIKHDLGYPGIVFGTIVGTSLPTIQAGLDAVDSHAYWQHPRFPGRPWDRANWFVANKSMVNEPPGCIGRIAGEHVAGKPHFVTEYNHPAPNTYSSEGPLLLAAYAAYHDLDGIFMFDYGHDWNARRITGFFDLCQHPTKMANMPIAAALFRRGDVRAGQAVTTIAVDAATEQALAVAKRRGWGPVRLEDFGLPWTATLVGRTAMHIVPDAGAHPSPRPAPSLDKQTRFRSDTGELVWDVGRPRQGVVTVDTPRTKAVIGFVDGRSFDLGGVTIAPGRSVQDWCTAAVTLLDGDSFSDHARALVVITGTVENTGMGWKNRDKTTVGRDWGRAPSRVEAVPVTVELPVPAARVRAFSLDEHGQRARPVTVRARGPRAVVDLNRTDRTLWYELVIE